MSHMAAIAMEILWSLHLLVVLFSVHLAHSHRSLQGLSCLNDYVNNVSCTWNSSQVDPGEDCWIHGIKKTWEFIGSVRQVIPMNRSCKLKQLESHVHGCSFIFENKCFSYFEVMPSIKMECNGVLVENLTNYIPRDHIKMHPPSVPNVSTSANETWISWSPGSTRPFYLTGFEFQLQIKETLQKWKEVTTLSTQEQELRIPDLEWKAGHYQVRVRVKPPETYSNTHWSNWSPTASWVKERDTTLAPEHQVPLLDGTFWFVLGGICLSVLFIVILLVLRRACLSRGLFKRNPVPDPSKYFHSLHSVHRGNFKKWLNHQSASESFFTAQPCDHISPVEVFDVWDLVPSRPTTTTPTSTSVLLHSHQNCPSGDLGSSSGVDHSSSSSLSSFSNLGYFYSSYPSDPLQINHTPVYFSYQDDFHNTHNSHNLHLSLCPSLTSSPSYERLQCNRGQHKREPQSPDSGFGIGKEDQVDGVAERDVDVDGEEISGDHQGSPLLIFPLHLPSQMCPPSPPSPSPHPPSVPQVHPDNQGLEVLVVVPSGSYMAWPVGSAMCRSSSMAVEPSKAGYLTLKELQTTYSNKSI